MKVSNKNSNRTGALVIELLVSIFVFSIISVSIVSWVLNSGSFIQKENNIIAAINLAEEGQNAALSISQGSWTNLTSGTFGISKSANSWILSGNSDTNGIFTRQLTITQLSTTTKQVVTNINWLDNGQNKQISFEQTLSNWTRSVQSQGGTTYNVGDSATAIFKNGNYAHLGLNNPSKSYAIVDVTNPLNPNTISSLNLNNSANSVFVYNSFAYVALNSNNVAVINVQNPLIPQQVSSIFTGVTPNIVYAYQNYLYIGLNRSSYGIYVYNISNPYSPQYYGRYYTGAPVNDIKILNPYIIYAYGNGMGFDFSQNYNYAFVAVNFADHGFEVYTIPNINKIYELQIGGSGTKVATDGNTAYVSVSDQNNGLAKLNVTNPTQPTLISNSNVEGPGNGVTIDTNYIYMAVDNRNGGLYIKSK